MPIHTVAPDNVEYIRIIDNVADASGRIPLGSVGRVTSRGCSRGSAKMQSEIVIANIVGHGEKIFNRRNTELITEKEYFNLLLKGVNAV